MEKVISKPKTPPRGRIFISRQDVAAVVVGIFGFFIGRLILFQTVNPVAAGFLANFLATSPYYTIVAVFLSVGLFTKLGGLHLAKYLFCIGIMSAVHFFCNRRRVRPGLAVKSAVAAGSVLFSGLALAAANDFSLYFFLMAVTEGVLTFFLPYILKKGTDVVQGVKRKKILAGEEMISVAILLGAVIAGAADIHFAGVSLRLFLVTAVILAVAFKGGAALGGTCGLLLGLMLYVVGFGDDVSIITYATAGMCAGALRDKGKLPAVSGFALVFGFLTFYLSRSLPDTGALFSVGLGSLAFLFMPSQFYFNVNSSINPVLDNAEEYIARVKEITTHKLMSFAQAFAKLARTFSGLSEKRTGPNQNDVSRLIDDIAAKACGDCSITAHCWEYNFYETYQAVFSMLGDCDRKGSVEAEDVSPEFSGTCLNLKNFVDVANRLFELNKINLAWRQRLVESRELVSQQLTGVSTLIKGLAEDLDLNVNFKEDLEAGLLLELSRNKVEVESVIVLENKAGKYEVNLTLKPCLGKKRCLMDVSPVVSRVLGCKMKPEQKDCVTRKGMCRLRLVEEQKFRVTSGVAKLSKSRSRQSGDSYSFMELKNGQCLLALSDGMGSGARAKEESAAAIGLLEDFIESGFEKEMAVKMINSALVLKSSEDSFSTLDICAIDLYTGGAEFIKIGAASTFLLRNGAVSVIKSTSLPIGILNTVDLEVCTKILKSGDIVLMVTDGLIEINAEADRAKADTEKGVWIVEALTDYTGANPQDVADYILAEAERRSEGRINDDMTVLAARLWEKKTG